MTTSLYARTAGFTTGEHVTPLIRARRVVEYRRILWLLVTRDIKVRYSGNLLGYVWTVLEPLSMSVVYWFMFTKILDREIGFPPFILFLVTGQLPWSWISGSISGSLNALRGESQMVRSTNVPREIWVLRVVLSKGAEYVFSLPVLVVFGVAYLQPVSSEIVWLPVAVLESLMITTGLGLIIAPIAVLVPDIKSIVRIVIRVLFYLTPILYSITIVKTKLGGWLAEVSSWNALAGIMVMYRLTFFPQEYDLTYIWHSMVVTAIVFSLGVWCFRRYELPMLKEI